MIIFDKVSKYYAGGHMALSEVSFQLATGEMAFLTGHSGAGKSTLLKLATLVERSTQGQITVCDCALKTLATRRIPYLRRHIGIIFQNPKLLTDRSVFDNVALPLVVVGTHYQEICRRVRAALDKVGLLTKEKNYPHQLSGGEQQRVSIARAIVSRPRLLLADEPTGNLDPSLSLEIMQLLLQFNQVGVSVLIASHDFELIRQMPHRVLTLNAGRLT